MRAIGAMESVAHMQKIQEQQFDDTGKVVFDDAYNQPDPRMYFDHLGECGYRIAGEAQPVIATTLEAVTNTRQLEQRKVIDIGSSYGINAALMKCDITLKELYDHYLDDAVAGMDRREVVQTDIRYYKNQNCDPDIKVVGIDVSEHALQYGVETGLLDAAIAKNLEEERLAPAEEAKLQGADLVMSTGAIGYVTEETVGQVLDATTSTRPWVANTVLRMFPYDAYVELLAEMGYVTEKLDTTLRQREFANEEERENCLENLRSLGLDPEGKESDGSYHAEFFLSRPADEAKTPVFENAIRLA